jgi:fumarylacetoacetate (FAA) hydrolase
MNFHFGELIAYAAHSKADRRYGDWLGTVSNATAAGSSCIAERRAIEKSSRAYHSPFMRFGDRVRMQAHLEDGRPDHLA